MPWKNVKGNSREAARAELERAADCLLSAAALLGGTNAGRVLLRLEANARTLVYVDTARWPRAEGLRFPGDVADVERDPSAE